MNRQPPKTALQYGRVNRVKLSRRIVQEYLNAAGVPGIEPFGRRPITINADKPIRRDVPRHDRAAWIRWDMT